MIDVYISAEADFRLWRFIDSVTTEIGGMGYAWIEGEEKKCLVIKSVFLLPQYASASEVDFEGTNGDAAAIERAVADDVLGKPGMVWFSWHSHHTMQAYWSPTDEERIAGLGKSGIPAVLSLVGNHSHEYKLRYDLFNVQHNGVTFPTFSMDELRLRQDPWDESNAAILKEIEENVKKRPVPAFKGKQQQPKGKPGWTQKPKAPAPGPARVDEPREPTWAEISALSAQRKFEMYDLVKNDEFTLAEAYEWVITEPEGEGELTGAKYGYEITPAGVVEYGGGFDAMAWEAD